MFTMRNADPQPLFATKTPGPASNPRLAVHSPHSMLRLMSSCGCNSSSGVGYSQPSATYSGSTQCPMPQRTSTQPTVPQRFSWLPKVVPKYSGQALVRVGDEMGVLSSEIDGVLLFDSTTENVYVGQPEINWIPDSYACTDSTLYGYPAYALRPDCGGSDTFPARNLAVMRPGNSSTGTLWAHQWSCGGLGGPAQEMTPVEISPEAMPETIPDDLQYLSYVRTAPTVCGREQFTFYANPGVLVAPDSKVLLVTMPDRPLTEDDNDDLRIAAWARLDDGRMILKSITDESFQVYINTAIQSFLEDQGFDPKYLNPRLELVSQTENEIVSYIYPSINLADFPGYNVNSKEVQLFVAAFAMVPAAGTRRYAFYIEVNGVKKYTGFAGDSPTGFRGTGEIHVPIPADKMLTIKVVKDVYQDGPGAPVNSSELRVYLEAFK